MSWSDDIRCLYCDGRLPLYRKITQGQFCSSAHRKEYWKEQERLAVERLTQTHDSLLAFKPPLQEPLSPPRLSSMPVTATLIALEPQTFESPVPELAQARIAAPPAAVTEAVETTIPLLTAPFPERILPALELFPRLLAADPLEYEMEAELRHPQARTEAEELRGLQMLGRIAQAPVKAHSLSYGVVRIDVDPFESVVIPALPVNRLLDGADAAAQEETAVAPLAERLYPLAQIAVCGETVGRGPRVASVHPVRRTGRPEPGSASVPVPAVENHLGQGKLLAWDLHWTAADHQAGESSPEPLDFRRHLHAEFRLGMPAQELRAGLAPGCRYPLSARPVVAKPARRVTEPVEGVLFVNLPARDAERLADAMHQPGLANCLPLELSNKPAGKTTPQLCPILASPQPARMDAVLPQCRLEPLGANAAASMAEPPPVAEAGQASFRLDMRNAWQTTSGFWQHAPRDLKILLFAVPLLMALAFHPSLPKVTASSLPATTGLRQVFHSSLTNFKQSMVERAAVALDEDFRTGLDEWASRSGEPAAWSYDATGFVQPGDLALYGPSAGLTDYQMQFLGMIDKKALSWVVRAADFDNYYVVKMMITKGGPLPEIGITRYAVVNGKAMDRADTKVPISARPDTIYRINMDIHGDDFVLGVQGQLVDSWSDTRLRRGGVGFFTARGEESRVRWVQVTHQYDMLGRLCAYLAP